MPCGTHSIQAHDGALEAPTDSCIGTNINGNKSDAAPGSTQTSPHLRQVEQQQEQEDRDEWLLHPQETIRQSLERPLLERSCDRPSRSHRSHGAAAMGRKLAAVVLTLQGLCSRVAILSRVIAGNSGHPAFIGRFARPLRCRSHARISAARACPMRSGGARGRCT